MDDLIAGYGRFRAERWPKQRALYERRLANGQSPRALVISCVDSRVDPAVLFDAAPGELLVLRNVANLVAPPEAEDGLHGVGAAVEFAVENLQVEMIVVLGHSGCGGVAAALAPDRAATGKFIARWVHLLDSAAGRLPADCADRQRALERESVRVSLERLMGFPFVARALQSGKLRLEGAVFDIRAGRLERLDRETGVFKGLAETQP